MRELLVLYPKKKAIFDECTEKLKAVETIRRVSRQFHLDPGWVTAHFGTGFVEEYVKERRTVENIYDLIVSKSREEGIAEPRRYSEKRKWWDGEKESDSLSEWVLVQKEKTGNAQ